MIFRENVPLSGLNTFKTGGSAKFFCIVGTVDELKNAVCFVTENKLPFFVLGGGSNALFSDRVFEGLVIKMEMMGRGAVEKENGTIHLSAAAGESWDKLVSLAVGNNFYGIENLSGIPGTVGGAAVQNIGAYGAEAGDSIIEVEILDVSDMKVKTLNVKERLFSYRDSIFKKLEGKNYIVTRVLFRLKKEGELNMKYKDIREYFENKNVGEITLKDLRSAVLEIRSKKFPNLNKFGTAGSFFKNPTVNKNFYESLREKYPQIPTYPVGGENFRISLAWILDNICGLKGFKKGAVGLYENQPLVLTNFGGASANDIKNLADEIARTVKEKIGIEIDPEVVCV
ncbi:MAG: UDP-N-acetylmuramate dehydrogenase [Patescibacteria group bacterium]|nr:UDP-N-acetylmuramate dehydrogenase [Patescibacteria group bacterium]